MVTQKFIWRGLTIIEKGIDEERKGKFLKQEKAAAGYAAFFPACLQENFS
jgi:hypothetical protein